MDKVASQLPTKPFIKWAGGKAQLLKKFENLFPARGSYQRYIEPFVGGGSVFFHLCPQRGVIADLNEDLINCYDSIKSDPSALMEKLLMPQFKNDKESFYEIRRKFNSGVLTGVERAAAFIYLNKTCFNGLYRVNNSGHYNVPFGKNKYSALFDKDNILGASSLLQNVVIKKASFAETCADAIRGDFVYFDPPYDSFKDVSPNFTKYTKTSFLKKEQEYLAENFKRLDKIGCKVMLSNADTPLINKLYHGYRIERISVTRFISADGGLRKPVAEVVVMNY